MFVIKYDTFCTIDIDIYLNMAYKVHFLPTEPGNSFTKLPHFKGIIGFKFDDLMFSTLHLALKLALSVALIGTNKA